MSWQEISDRDWDLIPGKAAKETDEIDQMLDQVEQGKIIRYTVKGDKDAVSKRLSFGRRAKRRGFTIEIRAHGGQLAVRKTGGITAQPERPATGVQDDTPPETPTPRRRRSRKGANEGATEAAEVTP